MLHLRWENTKPIAGQIVSISGQKMMTFEAGNAPNEIDLNSYPAGMYMLQVVTEEQSVLTKKFVKAE